MAEEAASLEGPQGGELVALEVRRGEVDEVLRLARAEEPERVDVVAWAGKG